MNYLENAIARFAKYKLVERWLIVMLVSVVAYMIVDTAILPPQQQKIIELKRMDQENKAELTAVALESTKETNDALLNTQELEDIKKQISAVKSFYGSEGATSLEAGQLLKEILDVSPGLTLVSMKTLPVSQLFTIDNKAPESATQKPLYKHGIEVSISGNYMALLAYMEHLQKYPKSLFWSQAKLDTSTYPVSELNLVIYSLSDQASTPLL
jgi:MSHA biogenesis protein MshJ